MPLTGKARWLAFLNRIDPRVVKQVDSLGRIINQADALGWPINAVSRLGRGYRSFWSGSIPTGETYYFALVPPPGIKVVGISRVTSVFGGRVDATFLVGGSYTTAAYTKAGFNLDETLEDVAQSSLVRMSDYDELGEARSSGSPIIAPGTGVARQASVQSDTGADPAFDDAHLPVFRYTNPSGSAAVDVWLDILFEEIPLT